ncbi:MAG: hypothetical protein PPP58_11355 [Natronomonas sp.]
MANEERSGTESGPRYDPRGWSRRRLLTVAGATVGGTAIGGRLLTDPEDAATTALTSEESRTLAERFAPDVYFDRHEKWFLTDPRAYESEADDGRTIVDGFDALDGYTVDLREASDPPRPIVFYNAVRYEESPLAVVQFWMYEAFDQFTTNFHWHDWEVLHVFVDLDTGEPQLYVASSHGRNIPNNEFLDPERQPSVIAELGAHASALSVNESRDRFQRFSGDGLPADITNQALESVEQLANIPAAYGLPRDENLSLPFAIPELDGQPLYEDDRLPNVDRDAFIAPELTVREYGDLVAPPEDLPLRETGRQFTPSTDPDPAADHSYDLEPASAVEHIEAFTGPMLRFEFDVPDVAEDSISGHLSSTDVPWGQPRYENPAEDITDPAHRRALADRYDAIDHGGPVATVAGALQESTQDDDAPEENGITTTETSTLSFCLLESDPTAVPSWSQAAVVRDVEPGEHRLTINAPGAAPYSERISADAEATTTLGADGAVTLVHNENAVKIDGDAGEGPDLQRIAIEDDFGGRLFDFRPESPDRFAAYVDRNGAYTTEIRDTDGEIGAVRVNPGEETRRAVEPRTGKTPLSTFIADIASETAAQAPVFAGEDDTDGDDANAENPDRSGESDPGGTPDDPLADPSEIDIEGVQGLQRALQAVADSAERAAERAERQDTPGADRALEAVEMRLERVVDAIERNDFDEELTATVERRLEQANRRTEQALTTEKP